MTVREAFSKAFGEVPEGATCHIGHTEFSILPVITLRNGSRLRWLAMHEDWEDACCGASVVLDDRPGESLRSLFSGRAGERYDDVLDEVKDA